MPYGQEILTYLIFVDPDLITTALHFGELPKTQPLNLM